MRHRLYGAGYDVEALPVGALIELALLPVVALATIHFLPRWSLRHFSAGLFRVSIAKDIIESNKWQLPELVYYHDGIATTVSVEAVFFLMTGK